MKTAFEKIAFFNQLIGNSKGDGEYYAVQLAMIKEEFEELQAACKSGDRAEIRDGIADVLVTVYGLAHRYGIDADADLETVNDSNMSKFVGGGFEDARRAAMEISSRLFVHCEWVETAPNIWAITSAYDQMGNDAKFYPRGKLLKPAHYLPPHFE